jgi:hypothetical protein
MIMKCLIYLSEFGEEEDLENWELVDEREVDYDQEEALDKMIGLASTGTANQIQNLNKTRKLTAYNLRCVIDIHL